MSAYHRQLRSIANEFMEAADGSFSARDVARWAIGAGRWKPKNDLAERRLAEDLADAMRGEHHTDPQGRTVRSKHVARRVQNGKSEMLWDDIRRAPRKHMEIALTQRRDQIVGDCKALKNDVDSYNENTCPTNPIQMSFNFTLDLEELEAAAHAEGSAA